MQGNNQSPWAHNQLPFTSTDWCTIIFYPCDLKGSDQSQSGNTTVHSTKTKKWHDRHHRKHILCYLHYSTKHDFFGIINFVGVISISIIRHKTDWWVSKICYRSLILYHCLDFTIGNSMNDDQLPCHWHSNNHFSVISYCLIAIYGFGSTPPPPLRPGTLQIL